MRGKALENGGGSLDVRITPACAGKRQALAKALSRSRDHPRMCGEKFAVILSPRVVTGSPPHVRGKGLKSSLSSIQRRITPACAGKSFLKSFSQSRSGDHPRVCGEKLRKTAVSVRELGSPPRMRGKETLIKRPWHMIGITPAYAGKSADCVMTETRDGDHPRVCGEKTKKIP